MGTATYEELQRRCELLTKRLESCNDTQNELMQSRRQITQLFNNLPGMVYRCSLDKALVPTLVFASNGSRELLGVSPEYLTNQHTNVVELMSHPDDLPETRLAVKL